MSDTTERITRSERNEDLMTVLSGWGALVLFVLGIHRWVSEGTFDWWARAGLIFSLGLAIKAPTRLAPDLSGALLEAGDKQEKVTDFTEKAITGAVLKLTRSTTRKIEFLGGHGELSTEPGSAAQNSMATVAEMLKNVQ